MAEPTKCPRCGNWYVPNSALVDASCAVAHGPDDCCHYAEIAVVPPTAEEEGARSELLHCKMQLFNEGVETKPIECWGTPTDVAATFLEVFEDPNVDGVVVSIVRGLPDDMVMQPRTNDPRSET